MDKKHCDLLRLFFTATALEGLAAAVLVTLSPTGSSISYTLNTALAVAILLLSLCFVWLLYRTAHSPEICERFYARVDRLRSNKKAALFVWLGLAITIIIIIGLLAIPTGITGINLVVKRITYPLVWIGLIAAQFGFLLQGSYPLGDSVKFFFQDVLPVTTGSEDIPSNLEKKSRLIFSIGLMITILFVLNLFIVRLPDPGFMNDSYKYWQLSTTIGKDFYRVNYYVQYIFEGDHSVDAPPLFPAILWLVNRIYDFKVYAGFVFNILVVFAILVLLLKISQHLFLHPIFALLVFLNLISFSHFQDELTGGRIIPLAAAFQLYIMLVIVKNERLQLKQAALLGLLAGLNILSRFDFLLASLVLGLVMISIDKEKWWQKMLVFYSLLVAASLPWIIYSYSHFGVPMVSKDARTVTSVIITHSNHYFPKGQEPLTIFDAPLLWLPTMLSRVQNVCLSVYRTVLTTHYKWFFLIILIVMILLLMLQLISSRMKNTKIFERNPATIRITKLGLVFLTLWFSTALSGYAVRRYYTPLFLFLAIWLFTLISQQFRLILDRRRLSHPLMQAVLLIPIIFSFSSQRMAWDMHLTPAQLKHSIQSQWLPAPEHELLEDYPGTPVVMISFGYRCPMYAIISGIKTYCMPYNLNDDNIDAFIKDHNDITHLLVPLEEDRVFLARHFELKSIDAEIPMYEIIRYLGAEN